MTTTAPAEQNLSATNEAAAHACVVCGGAQASTLYEGILRCDLCGHVFADMRLSDEDLFRLYNEEFFTGAEFSDYASDERYVRKNFGLRFKELRRFLDPARHKRLLEIGSAYGFFLDTVKQHFESAEGIDITDAGTIHARERLGLNVVQADFLAHDYGRKKFDVVCMWDTVEHLREPHLYVEKIAAHTEPGALLALTTGDIESLNARLRGRSWRLIHPPTHLHYFSPATVARMLDAHGFEVVYNRYCGFWRSFGNVAYNVLVLRQNKPALFRPVERTGLARLGFYLNLYDIMYVIARRR
ncbi:MAG TPA: class I SAM-dependent methyltransferase [Pyrinomonadaceae bacterium]|nr:class I SAM-dependent methyltransferase [Pyrinomonadaceae bacterium]